FRDKGILIKHCAPLAENLAGRWPSTILSKFYLFTPEFKKWDKIIYLDADLIVTASLDNLLNVKGIGGIGMRRNYFYQQIRLNNLFKFYKFNRQYIKDDLEKYGSDLPIFCAGLLAINTDIINSKTFNDLKVILGKYKDVVGGVDELMLSLCFAKNWENLPPTYCLHYNHLQDCHIKLKNVQAVTAHFFAPKKPIYFCKYIYELWKNNLDKADMINLGSRQLPKKYWSDEQLKKYHDLLKLEMILSWPRLCVDRFCGICGFALKISLPRAYYFLLKLKNHQSISLIKKDDFDRFIGRIGMIIKKQSPWLYSKIKRLVFSQDSVIIKKNSERRPYVIRPYQLGDETGLGDVFKGLSTQMDYAKWVWKYKKCPMGSISLTAENETKDVVGHFAVIIQKIKYYDGQIEIHQIADVVLEKEFRGQGFLEKCFSVFFKKGDFLPWGFVNSIMDNAYGKSVSTAGAKHPNKTIKSNVLQKEISRFSLLRNNCLRIKPENELQINKLTDGEREINCLWDRKKSEIKVGVIRDWKFIKWRTVESLENTDMYIIKKKGEVIGYFSLEIYGSSAVISDILVINKYADKVIFAAMENICFGRGIKRIKIFTTDDILLEILNKNGYLKGETVYFTYNDSLCTINPEDIYLTFIDADWSLDS
ncbi:MAG: glycosyltransferase, partial [Candidatus Buchananbacteria bacterium]